MSVRNLKILKGVIYAEVEVAGLDNGGWVTMNVKLGKGEDPAVTEALTTLNAAVEAVAQRHMQQASDNRIIDKRVDDRIAHVRKTHEKSLLTQRAALLTGAARKIRDGLVWVRDEEAKSQMYKIAGELEQDGQRAAS